MHNIIKEYQLLEYQHCMWMLYDDLENWLISKFPDGKIAFAPNERIVFLLYDLDYFVKEDFPGFSLYNLQLILKALDIPNFTCVVVSNMPGYDRYTKMVRDLTRPEDVPLRAISISPETDSIKTISTSTTFNAELIRYPFVILSRLKRPHRTLFMAHLFKNALQSKGLVSYHNIDADNDFKIKDNGTAPVEFKKGRYPIFLTTMPFTSYNADLSLMDPTNVALYNDFTSSISKYCNFIENTDISSKSIAMKYCNDPIQNALVYIALESVARYPTAFQSGISFKSIVQKRPFIIFGAPGCVRLMQDQGFQTFDQWWDESYDNDPDMESRLEKIIDIIKYLSRLSTIQITELYNTMQSVIEYNYQHLCGSFIQQELSKKDQMLSQCFIAHD